MSCVHMTGISSGHLGFSSSTQILPNMPLTYLVHLVHHLLQGNIFKSGLEDSINLVQCLLGVKFPQHGQRFEEEEMKLMVDRAIGYMLLACLGAALQRMDAATPTSANQLSAEVRAAIQQFRDSCNRMTCEYDKKSLIYYKIRRKLFV